MSHKKLSPAALAKARAASSARAPLLILLTRKFGFVRISPREAHVAGKAAVLAGIYRCEIDNRVYQVHIMGSGIYHAAYVSRPGDAVPGEAVTFKDKAGLLAALADCAMRPLPPIAHTFKPEPAGASDLTDMITRSSTNDSQPALEETPASKLFTDAAAAPKVPPADAWK